jgi:hypothetical protein
MRADTAGSKMAHKGGASATLRCVDGQPGDVALGEHLALVAEARTHP